MAVPETNQTGYLKIAVLRSSGVGGAGDWGTITVTVEQGRQGLTTLPLHKVHEDEYGTYFTSAYFVRDDSPDGARQDTVLHVSNDYDESITVYLDVYNSDGGHLGYDVFTLAAANPQLNRGGQTAVRSIRRYAEGT